MVDADRRTRVHDRVVRRADHAVLQEDLTASDHHPRRTRDPAVDPHVHARLEGAQLLGPEAAADEDAALERLVVGEGPSHPDDLGSDQPDDPEVRAVAVGHLVSGGPAPALVVEADAVGEHVRRVHAGQVDLRVAAHPQAHRQVADGRPGVAVEVEGRAPARTAVEQTSLAVHPDAERRAGHADVVEVAVDAGHRLVDGQDVGHGRDPPDGAPGGVVDLEARCLGVDRQQVRPDRAAGVDLGPAGVPDTRRELEVSGVDPPRCRGAGGGLRGEPPGLVAGGVLRMQVTRSVAVRGGGGGSRGRTRDQGAGQQSDDEGDPRTHQAQTRWSSAR